MGGQNDVKQKWPDFFLQNHSYFEMDVFSDFMTENCHDMMIQQLELGGSMRSMLFIVGFTCTSTVFLGVTSLFCHHVRTANIDCPTTGNFGGLIAIVCLEGIVQSLNYDKQPTLTEQKELPALVDFKQERGNALRFLCS